MDSSDEANKPNIPEPINQKRLSDDTTSNSSSDSEEEQALAPPAQKVDERPIEEWTMPELLNNDEKMQEYLESFPEIRGRYTRADPGYAWEEDHGDEASPPIEPEYRPSQYGRGRGGYNQGNRSGYSGGNQRSGGRGSYYQPSDRPRGNYRGGSHYEDRGHGDRRHDDRGHGDRRHDNRGHGDRRHEDRGHGDRGHGDRSHEDRSHGDRGHGDRPPYGRRDRDQGDEHYQGPNPRKQPRIDHSQTNDPNSVLYARPPGQPKKD